jgi:hypothetical protein
MGSVLERQLFDTLKYAASTYVRRFSLVSELLCVVIDRAGSSLSG